MSGEYGPDDGPGKWVCSHCGSDKLTFEGDGTWNTETQRMDFEEACEKPFCQKCELRGWAKFVPLDERMAPQLSRDYEGTLCIVVDDDGEPVSHYTQSRARALGWRDEREEWKGFRVARVAFKVLVPDDGSPVEIVDDPRREDE